MAIIFFFFSVPCTLDALAGAVGEIATTGVDVVGPGGFGTFRQKGQFDGLDWLGRCATGCDRSPGARLWLVEGKHGTTAIACLACVGPHLPIVAKCGGAFGKDGRTERGAVMAQHQVGTDAAIAGLVIPSADRARKGWAAAFKLAAGGGSHKATSQTLQGETVVRMVLLQRAGLPGMMHGW